MDVLVDSNVLLDVFTEDPRWYGRSAAVLAEVAGRHELVVNPIVYAEVSVGFERIGAHAAIRGIPLLTRDAGRYRTYVPRLELIVP